MNTSYASPSIIRSKQLYFVQSQDRRPRNCTSLFFDMYRTAVGSVYRITSIIT